ncbi:hypothetical protein M3J09_003303 [Ascochyta lentis]
MQLLPHQSFRSSRDAVVNKDSNDSHCVTASSRGLHICSNPLCPGQGQNRRDNVMSDSEYSVHVVGVTQGCQL